MYTRTCWIQQPEIWLHLCSGDLPVHCETIDILKRGLGKHAARGKATTSNFFLLNNTSTQQNHRPSQRPQTPSIHDWSIWASFLFFSVLSLVLLVGGVHCLLVRQKGSLVCIDNADRDRALSPPSITMLTFRRALIGAFFFITMLYLITRTHNTPAAHPAPASPPATGYKSASTTSSISMPKKPIPNSQRLLQDMSRAPLRDKLAYQFPYDVETKFPAYIWQTWKYTPASGEFGENFRPAEASWSEKHPGFIHEVITDQVAVHLLRHLYASVPEVLEAYQALPLPVLKADFFRYLILLARGGIYSDIDTHALKPATEWLPEKVPREAVGLVIGIEADPDREDWAEWYSRRIQFCQWTIQSKPGHPVLREIVANITQSTLAMKQSGQLSKVKDKNVIEFTGPALWTDTIFRFMNDERYFDMSTSKGNITWRDFTGMTASKRVGDVVVLPITSFSPGVQQMGAEDYDHPMAFVKHEFEGTWKPESERHIGQEQQ